MRLSTKSEYACLALIELSKKYGKDLIKIKEISERNKIPRKYLEQILLRLKTAGYLRSIRGANGGYGLSRHPRRINVAEVVRLMDGHIAPVESVSKYFFRHTPIERSKKLTKLLQEIRDFTSRKLEKTTFADLI